MARKKQPDPLFSAIKAIIDMEVQQGESLAIRTHWLSLWQQHFEGDKIAATDVHNAALMTSLVANNSVRDGEYVTALGYIDTFFTHPNIEQADTASLMLLRCDQMLSLLNLRRETEGLELGRSLLAYERRSDLPLFLLPGLQIYLLHRDPERTASSELTEFVWEVAQSRRFHKRRTLPSPATFGQIADALNQTWPKAERESVRESRREESQERPRSLANQAQDVQQETI